MRRFAALAVVVLGALASVAAAQAGTIGQIGAPDQGLVFNAGQDIAVNSYVVPAGGGLVTSLNTQSSACGNGFSHGTYNLQVLRPVGGNQYTVLGDTGNQTDPCDGQLHSYPVNIPVQAGDVLGVYVVSFWFGVLDGGSGYLYDFQSEPAVGDTITISSPQGGFTPDESATLLPVAQTMSDCKNGGWQTVVDSNGNRFKNQGDCVSFVATKGKNPGDG